MSGAQTLIRFMDKKNPSDGARLPERTLDRAGSLVVDLCGTLIREDTTRGFIRSLRLTGWRSYLARAANLPNLRKVCSLLRFDLARKFLVCSLQGIPKELLDAKAREYARSALEELGRPRVLEAIRTALLAGRSVYLATATLDPVALAVTNRLGLTGMVSSNLAYDSDGRCTGRLALDRTSCKWAGLQRMNPALGASKMTFYTDNSEDLDLMSQASEVHFFGKPNVRLASRLAASACLMIFED